MRAELHNNRQSPRKVRLVADMIRGKRADVALYTLSLAPKKAAEAIEKLLKSAVANAKNASGLAKENLIVKEIRIDKGTTLKRSMPRARGSAFPIKKRSSHIVLVLAQSPSVVKA